jgi:hypothetical protein
MIIVPAVGYDLWFFPESLDFGDSTSTGFVAALPPETVILKAAYVDRADQGRIDQALAPVRLPHAILMPEFAPVVDGAVRQHLTEHFEAFQRAVAAGAGLDVGSGGVPSSCDVPFILIDNGSLRK